MRRPPRITHVTLRRGTRYRVIEEERLSEPRLLDRDAEVEVRLLALGEGEASVYLHDGVLVVVAYEHEVRGERGSG